ncbi:MAG: OmpA family protein [Bacteroidales bacterium]|jgi:outer membrane protein OmpA-like peptidoglycan-associated protein|nr:OmpA family protein [Bacteroidales bacterium]
MKIKRVSIIVFTVLFTVTINAQMRHEFGINVGGGISMLNYDNAKAGFGGLFGVGYSFYFNQYFGINIGVDLSYLNSKYAANNLSGNYSANDGEEDFDFRYTINNFSEKQHALLVEIPLLLRFNTSLEKKTQFYAALGGKVGVPVLAKSTGSIDNLQTSGYYSITDLLLTSPRFMGFGQYTDLNTAEKLDFKPAFFVSAELGARFILSEKMALYTGVYIDYGLTNINKSVASETATAQLVEYDHNRDYSTNPYEVEQHFATSSAKVLPLQAGVKIGLAFVCNKKAKSVVVEKVTENPPFVDTVAEQQRIAAEKAEQERILLEKATQERILAEKAAQERLLAEQKAEQERVLAEQKAEQQLKSEIATIEQPINIYSVGNTTLSSTQQRQLDDKIALLQRHPNLTVVIEGHTCNIGTHEVNLKKGLQRAENAKKYMIEKGIDASRISTVSKAETEPLVPNTSEENRKQNRRVEIIILE